MSNFPAGLRSLCFCKFFGCWLTRLTWMTWMTAWNGWLSDRVSTRTAAAVLVCCAELSSLALCWAWQQQHALFINIMTQTNCHTICQQPSTSVPVCVLGVGGRGVLCFFFYEFSWLLALDTLTKMRRLNLWPKFVDIHTHVKRDGVVRTRSDSCVGVSLFRLFKVNKSQFLKGISSVHQFIS